jgi:hypothetical protein
MKLEKLMKKIEKFFSMDLSVQEKKFEKREELICSLDKKMLSMKDKIKMSTSVDKKEQLKKELDVLKSLREKL